MPAPSAHPVPSAAAENALHRPSAAMPTLPGELDERAGRGHHRHAAGQRQRALAGAAATGRPGAARPARRNTRCRPSPPGPPDRGRRRPGPTRRCRGRRCRRSPRRSLVCSARCVPVVVRAHAGEHPGVAAAQGAGSMPGPLERLPGGLQQQPLLRIHRQRLTRADAEERRRRTRRLRRETAFDQRTSCRGRRDRDRRARRRPSRGPPGTAAMASPRPATSRHRSSGDRTPPGYRQAMPTIAIGSGSADSASRRR